MADDAENSAKASRKTCSGCGQPVDRLRSLNSDWRPATLCRKCYNAAKRLSRPKYHELSAEERRKHIARRIAGVAVRRGKIEREPCVVCDSPNSQMHHPDYAKPLEVVWFCYEHHLQFHRLQGR